MSDQDGEMRLHIYGTRNKELRDRLRKASLFYASKLMKPRLSRTLEVILTLKKGYPDYGDCSWQDEPVRPKDFIITLRKASEGVMLKSLAHEMVHVKQYATGELRDFLRSETSFKWRGEVHERTDEWTSYWERPQEIEAFGRELGLYRMFLVHEKVPK